MSEYHEPHRNGLRSRAAMKSEDHRRLWMMVEGAVTDAFNCHPDYLTDRGRRSAVESVTKRVVGTLVARANQTLKGGRCSGS